MRGTNRPWQCTSQRSRPDVAAVKSAQRTSARKERSGASAYRDLKNQLLAIVVGLKGIENGGELLGVELDCRRQVVSAEYCDRKKVVARTRVAGAASRRGPQGRGCVVY